MPLSVTEIVKKVNPSVVSIVAWADFPIYETYTENTGQYITDFFGNTVPYMVRKYKQTGTEKKDIGGGSGFIVRDNGIVITNKHVVEASTRGLEIKFDIVLYDGVRISAKILYTDRDQDIAILKIDDNKKYQAIILGNSDALELGNQVIAIGNALTEFKNSISVGIISGLDRSIFAGSGYGNYEKLDKVIQTDAAINPGNSGGPLINSKAEVIGVNVATNNQGQNISFALPINEIKKVLAKLGL